MHYELSVLRALLRLARRRAAADIDQLLVRVGGAPADLRVAMRRLEQAGLVERLPGTGEGHGRLTLSGLAVAVASVANRRSASQVKAGAKSTTAKVPTIRRRARQKHRAA
jgi:DNA-binding MarR family transcriptional regulator